MNCGESANRAIDQHTPLFASNLIALLSVILESLGWKRDDTKKQCGVK